MKVKKNVSVILNFKFNSPTGYSSIWLKIYAANSIVSYFSFIKKHGIACHPELLVILTIYYMQKKAKPIKNILLSILELELLVKLSII